MYFYQTTPKMWFGPGALNVLPVEVSKASCSKCLVVVGPNVKRVGYAERAAQLIESAGAKCEIVSDVEPEPSLDTAERVAGRAKRLDADLVVGIGGGSSLDIAKVVSVLAGSDVALESILGIDNVPGPGIRCILVPTTAGTGTEMTPVAVLVDRVNGVKKVITSTYIYPDVAILDSELTLSLPANPTAYSGVDALTHALEAYTAKRRNPMTDICAAEALRLIGENLRSVCENGDDLQARDRMLFASMLAGKAFGNAGVTAVHALAHVAGARFDIPHGIANAIMLPHVVEFNIEADPARFMGVTGLLGVEVEGKDPDYGARKLIKAIRELISGIGLPVRLSEFGVEEKDIPGMAASALEDVQVMSNNPREVSLEDAQKLYRKAL